MTELHTEKAKRERRRVNRQIEEDVRAAFPNARLVNCEDCSAEVWYSGRGTVPKWCDHCRPTSAERSANYRRQNPDKTAAAYRAWYDANREKKRAYDRARYEKNREQRKAQSRRYYQENRDQVRAEQDVHRSYAAKCKECGEHLREKSPKTGLCGFCEEERVG